MRKLFTMGEVQTLLPLLESLTLRAQEAAHTADGLGAKMDDLRQHIFVSGGMHVDVGQVARQRSEQAAATDETKRLVAEIEEIGVHLHDLEEGLLDLPYRTEFGEVMLCWKVGEASVSHWHGEQADDAERRPIEQLFGRSEWERLH